MNVFPIEKEMKKLVRDMVVYGTLGFLPLVPVLIKLPIELISYAYPNITDKTEAFSILEEEKEKLGITQPIKFRFYENNELRDVRSRGYSGISDDGNGFVIGVNMGDLDRILIRHELYHIFKGDCTKSVHQTKEEDLEFLKKQREQLGLKYHFLAEPKAEIYSVSGLKL